MPTKTNTFTFTLSIQIIHTKPTFAIARTKSHTTPTTVEINYQEVTLTASLTEASIQENKLFTATIAIINGRGHALSLAPYCAKNHQTQTK